MDTVDPTCSIGIPGLDDVLGGLPRACLYLVEGSPGVGKTTLAMQFLLEGSKRGERGLYVTLSETKKELEAVARSHDWDLSGIEIVELSQVQSVLTGKTQTTLFQSSELELNEVSKLLTRSFETSRPDRLVIDSMSELRLLTQSALRFRRQILNFKQYFADAGCTVLLLDDKSSAGDAETHLHSLAHGVISLTSAPLRYGIFRRYLSVAKLRGVKFREGNHDYVIEKGGLVVFPRLVVSEHLAQFKKKVALSGNEELDALVGGGLHYGTSNLLIGPAGSGKSTVATMYAHAAATRGERVIYYQFDETVATLSARATEMGLELQPLVKSGHLAMEQINPADIAPGELAHRLRRSVEEHGIRIVVFDSLNGYVNAMPQEDFLHLHLHDLLTFLNQQGVMTVMILAQHGLLGTMGTPVDVSYLADSVIVFRYFEARGAVRKAISVIKKRSGSHEQTVRELQLTQTGVVVGAPLTNYQGVMTGVPHIVGADSPARQ